MGDELVLDLDEWLVTLRDGSVLRLLAHAYCREGDEYIFSALMRGKPHYEMHLARIPASIVAKVLSA